MTWPRGVIVSSSKSAESTAAPGDLCAAALKAARRLQALPANRVYSITLVKGRMEWLLGIADEQGTKIERLK